MLAYGLTADDAFMVLRWHSEHLNVKVRQLARRTLAAVGTDPRPAPACVRAVLEPAMAGEPMADPPAVPAPAGHHLALRHEPDGPAVRVIARGELDAATAPALVAELLTALRHGGGGTVTADLREVRWVGAAGAEQLGRLRRRFSDGGSTLRVVTPTSTERIDEGAPELPVDRS
jgi:anti-anti-sigma regulatory factor